VTTGTKVDEGVAGENGSVGEVPDVELAELSKRVAELEAQAQQHRDAFLQPLREQMKDLEAEVATRRKRLEATKEATSVLDALNGGLPTFALIATLLPLGALVVHAPARGVFVLGGAILAATLGWLRGRRS
jgi:hypothetical protein